MSALIENIPEFLPQLLINHALIIGDDDEIIQAQMRRVIRSIVEKLLTKFQSQILRQRLAQVQSHICQGYAADNLEIILGELDKQLTV